MGILGSLPATMKIFFVDTFKIEKGMSQTAIINRFGGKLLEKGQGLSIFKGVFKHVIMQSRGLEHII